MIAEFDILKPYADRLKAGYTDKEMGSFKEDAPDFQTNVEQLGMGQPNLANQIHSDIILRVDEPLTELPDADALITNQKGLLLMVKVADCQGVVIYDPVKSAVAAVHSGWKGSSKNIIGKTIQRMKAEYGCEGKDLLVGISPSLGPCCSEFSDPENELPGFVRPFFLPENHVDFWALSKKQCMDEGVLESHIENVQICTKDSPTHYSYRCQDAQRIAVLAKLT